VEVCKVLEYVHYFEIVLVPSTVFFYNGRHIKVDWPTGDHSKYVGGFYNVSDFVQTVIAIHSAGRKGKSIVNYSPIPTEHIPKFNIYQIARHLSIQSVFVLPYLCVVLLSLFFCSCFSFVSFGSLFSFCTTFLGIGFNPKD